jgi:thiol-disulfide isomerase/thioredoxin
MIVGVIIHQNRHSRTVPAATGIVANAPAPQFSFVDVNGQPVDSSKLLGKVVLVDFWATWCLPCESEIPQLAVWQNAYGPEGLQILGLSMDDSASPVKSYLEKRKIPYPIAMADEKTIASFGGVLGLPANIIIGRDGKLIDKQVGVSDMKVLEQEVHQALRSK